MNRRAHPMTSARRRILHCIITSLLSFICMPIIGIAGENSQILTFRSLGPVDIGMTVSEAEESLGSKLKSYYPDTQEGCWFGGRADGIDPRTQYMIQDEKIARIDISDSVVGQLGSAIPPISTERGIRIGSSYEMVKHAYASNVVVRHHPQANADDKFEDYSFMNILSDDRQYGLQVEIWNGKVSAFHAGAAEYYDRYEGC